MGAPMPPGIRQHQQNTPPEWAIACPVPACQARPNARCTTPRGRHLHAGSHPSRLDAWLVQQHAA